MNATKFASAFWLLLGLLLALTIMTGSLPHADHLLPRSSDGNPASIPDSTICFPIAPAQPSALRDHSHHAMQPTVNAHALAYQALVHKGRLLRGLARLARAFSLTSGQNTQNRISTAAMATQPVGSTLLVAVGRGKIAAFTQMPTDNLDNSPYVPLGPTHSYAPQYPGSGTALYACSFAKGGARHIITAPTIAQDEITLVAIEVKNGGVIQDCKWNGVLRGQPLTSEHVTTTGPATLVAFWWGDGHEGIAHIAVPNHGFTVIESLLSTGTLVQTAVATKDVTAAGSYNVTWDSGGLEGAQLYLVAVQSAPPALLAHAAGDGQLLSPSTPIKR